MNSLTKRWVIIKIAVCGIILCAAAVTAVVVSRITAARNADTTETGTVGVVEASGDAADFSSSSDYFITVTKENPYNDALIPYAEELERINSELGTDYVISFSAEEADEQVNFLTSMTIEEFREYIYDMHENTIQYPDVFAEYADDKTAVNGTFEYYDGDNSYESTVGEEAVTVGVYDGNEEVVTVGVYDEYEDNAPSDIQKVQPYSGGAYIYRCEESIELTETEQAKSENEQTADFTSEITMHTTTEFAEKYSEPSYNTTDPVEAAKEYVTELEDKPYVFNFEIKDAAILDPAVTHWTDNLRECVRSEGENIMDAYGWTADMIERGIFTVVRVDYYANFDHTKTPTDFEGDCFMNVYLVQYEDTGTWQVYDRGYFIYD